jgi:hypothetical protein
MTRTRIFVSFDRENDSDLSDLLSADSERDGSTFEIVKQELSKGSVGNLGRDTRSEIQASDEVLVICGEKTDKSITVATELAIAQEEAKPYMLLWGRRDKMCTRPDGARSTDAMYSWTREFLEIQISATLRDSLSKAVPEN